MNWDQLEGGWKQRRGKAVRQWGTMMKDDLTTMAGRYEELVGKLQERYGDARATAVRQQNDFARIVHQLRQANARLVKLLTQIKVKRPKPAGSAGASRSPQTRVHRTKRVRAGATARSRQRSQRAA